MRHRKLNTIAAAMAAACIATPQVATAQTRHEGTVTVEKTNGQKESFGERTIINNEAGLTYTDNSNQTHTIAANDVKNVTFDWHVKNTTPINYLKEISDEGAKQAFNDLQSQFGMACTGIYGLRGGKEGGLPEAHAYQFLNCYGPDCYVQYFCVPHSDFPYSNATLRSTYDLCKQFIGGPGSGFGFAKTNIAPALNAEQIDSLPEMKALYLLMYDYAAIEHADLFGPAPYSDYKNAKNESPYIYDEIRNIYHEVANDIDAIVNCLKYYVGSHEVTNGDGAVKTVPNRSDYYKKQIESTIRRFVPLLKDDAIEEGNLNVWIRLANSLKLRMAIHIADVEYETAKKWAEEAVVSGVAESTNDEVAIYPSVHSFAHPLIEITGWGDIVMGASFINLLQSLNHPYMHYLFTKNSVEFANTGKNSGSSAPKTTDKESVYVGMRAGATPGIGQAAAQNPLCGFSTPNKTYMSHMQPPLYLMKLSEVCFLRAEGAIRGWNMGASAQSLYEKGVRYAYLEDRNWDSQNEYLKLVDDYLKVNTPKDVVYVDPTGATPDMHSVTKVGVKWNDGDAFETKLEKIITQKYIASFPYSYEAWVDLRRTGYPKLFPVLNVSDGDGTIEEGDASVQSWGNIMRRIPWVSDDPQTMQDIENTGIPALAKDADSDNASDTQMQPLWWDKSRK